MKAKLTIAVLLLITVAVMARISSSFLGWDHLQAESPDIIVADPGDPTPPTTKIHFENGPRFDFSITVLSVLKGTNDVRRARLLADHELRTGEAYLVFGNCANGIYKAHGDFSVVPLGITFKQEMIACKPLDEQIQILLKLAVDNLNTEIAKKQAEKERIETGIQK